MLMNQFLRLALVADAVATAATGLLLVTASAPLADWLGIPSVLLFYVGGVLLPYAAVVGYLSSRRHVSRATVWTVVLCNAIWALDSVLLLFTGWVSPTVLGYGFVIAQAVVVAGFAEWQLMAIRRAPAVAVA